MNRDRLLRLLCRALLFLEAAGCVSILLGLYRRLFLPFFKEHPVWIDGVIIAAGGALLCAGLMALLRRSASCNGPLPRQLAIGGLPCLSGLLWYVVAITDGPRHMSLFSLFERPAWVIALLAIAFICILQAVSPEWRERVRPRFTTMRRGTAALCLALVVLAVLLLRISHLWGTIPAMTGDEPFYAIAADSLIDDGDLYLRNNTLSNKARIWYPTPLKVRPLLIHAPGTSLILVPFITAARRICDAGVLPFPNGAILVFAARLPAVLSTALLAALTFMLAEALTHRRGLSLLAGMLTGLTFPAAHVGVTVYPEMPAAACLAAAAYLILAQTECPLWRLWLGGLFIAPLPWLGLKYAPPGLLFLLLAGWVSRSHLLARARAFAVMCSPLALSVLGLSFYTRTLYGSYNPGSITGPMARHVLDRYNLTELAYSIQVFFGYFLDQKEGLLWKSPWMILALAAIPLAIKTWTRPLTVLVLTMTAHFAHYSYYTNWGLAGPPGRPVAAFCWVFALLLACGLSVKPFNRYFSWACVLSIISLLLTDLLYSDMSLLVLRYKWGDQPEWHPIFQWMSSVLPIPYAILPDYMTSPSHVLNLVAWALLTIILISVIGIKRIRSASPNRYMGLFIGSTLLAMLVQTPYLGKWIFEFHQAQKRSDIVQEGPLTVAPLLAGERLLPPVERKYRLRESRSMEFIAFTEQQPVSVQAKLSCTCPFSLWVDYFDQQQQLAGKEAAESNFDSNSFLQIDNYKCYYFGVRWNNKRKSKSRDDDDESESRGVFFQIINK